MRQAKICQMAALLQAGPVFRTDLQDRTADRAVKISLVAAFAFTTFQLIYHRGRMIPHVRGFAFHQLLNLLKLIYHIAHSSPNHSKFHAYAVHAC